MCYSFSVPLHTQNLKELKTMVLIMWIVTLVPDYFVITLIARGTIMPDSWYNFECGLKSSKILIAQFYSIWRTTTIMRLLVGVKCCALYPALPSLLLCSDRGSKLMSSPCSTPAACPYSYPATVKVLRTGWLQFPVPSSGALPENNWRKRHRKEFNFPE